MKEFKESALVKAPFRNYRGEQYYIYKGSGEVYVQREIKDVLVWLRTTYHPGKRV